MYQRLKKARIHIHTHTKYLLFQRMGFNLTQLIRTMATAPPSCLLLSFYTVISFYQWHPMRENKSKWSIYILNKSFQKRKLNAYSRIIYRNKWKIYSSPCSSTRTHQFFRYAIVFFLSIKRRIEHETKSSGQNENAAICSLLKCICLVL